MLRGLYRWVMTQAEGKNALWALAFISFIESSFFPIPPDIMLVPMILAARQRAWLIAGVCTIASVAGGLGGYAIGYFLFDTVGQPLLDFYHYADKFERFQAHYNEWGAWIVAFFGLTPFPYKVITIASGVTELNVATFTFASVLSRAARFFLEAALLWHFGAPIRAFIERRLGLLTTVFFVMLFLGFVLLKFVF
jgi:membrane protein YqaA with SNARE-associated domain